MAKPAALAPSVRPAAVLRGSLQRPCLEGGRATRTGFVAPIALFAPCVRPAAALARAVRRRRGAGAHRLNATASPKLNAPSLVQEKLPLHYFYDAAFQAARNQFVDSALEPGLDLREVYVDDLGVDDRAGGGMPTYMFKSRFVQEALEATPPGEYCLISDVDVQLFEGLAPFVRSCMQGLDACFQREFVDVGANIGFFGLRHNDAGLTFWKEVQEELTRTSEWDQKVVNNLLYTGRADVLGLRWGRFPPQVWAASQAFGSASLPEHLVLHHANFTVAWLGSKDPSAKLEQLQEVRELASAGDHAGLRRMHTRLAEAPALAEYKRRYFGDLRRGPEWCLLPTDNPGRLGRKRAR